MKKTFFVFLCAALLLSGCVTGNRLTKVYDNSYSYDRLYSSTLLALNSMQYTVTADGHDSGVVHASEKFGLYSALAWGVFGFIPYPYFHSEAPSITITVEKAVKGTMYDVTESTSSVLGNRIYTLLEKVEENYSVESGKSEPSYAGEGIKGSVAYYPLGTQIHNENSSEWKNITLNIMIGTDNGPKNFTGKYPVIYGGQTVPVDFSGLVCAEDKDLEATGKGYSYLLTCEMNGAQVKLSGKWSDYPSYYKQMQEETAPAGK